MSSSKESNQEVLRLLNSFLLGGDNNQLQQIENILLSDINFHKKVGLLESNQLDNSGKASAIVDFTTVSIFFATELDEVIRSDPTFTGTPEQITLLRELLSCDTWLKEDSR